MPPPPKVHKEAPIDPRLLDGYVETYHLDQGTNLTFTRDGDHLFLEIVNQPKSPMFPEGPRDFFFKDSDSEITFVTDSSGKATEIILRPGGIDWPGKRLANPMN
jgi:hypothetical protein